MEEKYNKAFLLASDSNQEDILEWTISNIRKHHSNIPIQLVDLGLSEEFKSKNLVDCLLTIRKRENLKAWYNKPRCLLATKSVNTIYLDTDCEILKSIEDLFEKIQENKLGMAIDQYYGKDNSNTQYNTGVILYQNKPKILFAWDAAITTTNQRGDQEVLKKMIEDDLADGTEFFTIPDKYNYVRLKYMKEPNIDDLRIIHWTGPMGKKIIREKKINMNNPSIISKVGHDWKPDHLKKEFK